MDTGPASSREEVALGVRLFQFDGPRRNHRHMLFASAKWLMRARAVALTG